MRIFHSEMYTSCIWLSIKWKSTCFQDVIIAELFSMISGHSFWEPDVIKDKLEPGVWYVRYCIALTISTRKGKEEYLYSAILVRTHALKALRHGSHSFYLQITPCLLISAELKALKVRRLCAPQQGTTWPRAAACTAEPRQGNNGWLNILPPKKVNM